MTKTALITGITGQDGSYLVEHLLSQGYRVLGHSRRVQPTVSHGPLSSEIATFSFDLCDATSWEHCLDSHQPDEIYHLAGVSFVPDSWKDPAGTMVANVESTLAILEGMLRSQSKARLFYACSSEIFGKPSNFPQNEQTPLQPHSPYGVSKAASHWLIESYRQRYGLFACSGILFNHESPRRDPSFVIRKITQAVAAISVGAQDKLILGNLDIARDWGFAGDYVDCMHRMLQFATPQDFTIGTGKITKLKDVVDIAFQSVGLHWQDRVEIDSRLIRANDSKMIVADGSKAKSLLNWQATTSIDALVEMMVNADLQLLKNQSRRQAA